MGSGQTPEVRHPRLNSWTVSLLPFLIFVFTAATFFPSLFNGFVDWDDEDTLLKNLNYRGLSLAHLRWMFSTFYMGHYQPLTWLTLALDYLTWGIKPLGYHLTSVLMHAASAALFYCVSLRILKSATGDTVQDAVGLRLASAFGGLLFATHPLRVESVAWVTERRDVLSGLFFLATIGLYLKAADPGTAQPRKICFYALSLAAYSASLLSKASGITLPLVLLLLDIFPLARRRCDRNKAVTALHLILEKIPYFLLASGFAVVAVIAQHQVGALKNLEAYGAARRLGQACYGLLFYVWKTLLPINLSPLYETPMQLSTSDELSFVIAGAIVCAVSVFLLREKRLKPLLAGWIYYGLLLLPVLGIAQSGPQLVADRYSYLACLSWAILGAAGFFYLWRNFRAARTIIGASATSLLVLLSALTWRQIGVWHDSTALWTRAVQIYPEGARSLTNYGAALMRNGEVEKAMEQYRKALRIVPFYSVAHNNLASALLSRGKYDLAIGEYREAIRLNPNFSQAYYNLGVTLVLAGQPKEAVLQFREALRIEPNFEDAKRVLALVLDPSQSEH